VEKSGVLEHKSGNISEKRKGRGKVTIEGSFERYHPRSPTPSTASSFPRFGVRNRQPHPKLQSILARISGTGKATEFKFGWCIHRVHRNKSQKLIKNFGEKRAWAYPCTAQIFWIPLLSQERVKLRTSNLAGTFIGSIATKAH